MHYDLEAAVAVPRHFGAPTIVSQHRDVKGRFMPGPPEHAPADGSLLTGGCSFSVPSRKPLCSGLGVAALAKEFKELLTLLFGIGV